MAKFKKEEPGNGMNIKYVFSSKEGKALPNEQIDYICGGILNHTLDFSCFYGPTVNSYKRFFEEEISGKWNKIGNNSEICGVNILNEDDKKKVHLMLPGADSNPYLVSYVALESALDGIKTKTCSKTAENNLKDKKLPITLNQANKLFRNSDFAKLVFGNDYHYHYNAFYVYEYQQYMNQVSLWEAERYLYSV